MGWRIEFSPEAIEDLKSIVSHIASDNPARADSFGNELVDRTGILEDFPMAGRMVPEFLDERIRELIYRSYRIVYRVAEHDKLIEVLRFWHAARDVPEL